MAVDKMEISVDKNDAHAIARSAETFYDPRLTLADLRQTIQQSQEELENTQDPVKLETVAGSEKKVPSVTKDGRPGYRALELKDNKVYLNECSKLGNVGDDFLCHPMISFDVNKMITPGTNTIQKQQIFYTNRPGGLDLPEPSGTLQSTEDRGTNKFAWRKSYKISFDYDATTQTIRNATIAYVDEGIDRTTPPAETTSSSPAEPVAEPVGEPTTPDTPSPTVETQESLPPEVEAESYDEKSNWAFPDVAQGHRGMFEKNGTTFLYEYFNGRTPQMLASFPTPAVSEKINSFQINTTKTNSILVPQGYDGVRPINPDANPKKGQAGQKDLACRQLPYNVRFKYNETGVYDVSLQSLHANTQSPNIPGNGSYPNTLPTSQQNHNTVPGDPTSVEQLSAIDPEIGVVDREKISGEENYNGVLEDAKNALKYWTVSELDGKIIFTHRDRKEGKLPMTQVVSKVSENNKPFIGTKDNPGYIVLKGFSYGYKAWIENNKVYMEVMPFGMSGVSDAVSMEYTVRGIHPVNQKEEYDAAMEGLKSFSCGIKNYGSRSQTDILTDMMQPKNGKIELEYGLGTTLQSSSFPIPKDLQEKLIMGADILYYKLGQRTQVGEDVYVQMMLEKRGGRVYIEAKLEAQKSSKLNPVDPEWKGSEQLKNNLIVTSSNGEKLLVTGYNKKLTPGPNITNQKNVDEINKMSVDTKSTYGPGLKIESGIGRDQLYLDVTKAVPLSKTADGKETFLLTIDNGGLESVASDSKDWEIQMTVSEPKKLPSGRNLGRVASFAVVGCPKDLKTTAQAARDAAVTAAGTVVDAGSAVLGTIGGFFGGVKDAIVNKLPTGVKEKIGKRRDRLRNKDTEINNQQKFVDMEELKRLNMARPLENGKISLSLNKDAKASTSGIIDPYLYDGDFGWRAFHIGEEGETTKTSDGGIRYHKGLDISQGTQVVSVLDGTIYENSITSGSRNDGGGLYIAHPNKVTIGGREVYLASVYRHVTPKKTSGNVSKGEKIAEVGSTSDHAHVEILMFDRPANQPGAEPVKFEYKLPELPNKIKEKIGTKDGEYRYDSELVKNGMKVSHNALNPAWFFSEGQITPLKQTTAGYLPEGYNRIGNVDVNTLALSPEQKENIAITATAHKSMIDYMLANCPPLDREIVNSISVGLLSGIMSNESNFGKDKKDDGTSKGPFQITEETALEMKKVADNGDSNIGPGRFLKNNLPESAYTTDRGVLTSDKPYQVYLMIAVLYNKKIANEDTRGDTHEKKTVVHDLKAKMESFKNVNALLGVKDQASLILARSGIMKASDTERQAFISRLISDTGLREQFKLACWYNTNHSDSPNLASNWDSPHFIHYALAATYIADKMGTTTGPTTPETGGKQDVNTYKDYTGDYKIQQYPVKKYEEKIIDDTGADTGLRFTLNNDKTTTITQNGTLVNFEMGNNKKLVLNSPDIFGFINTKYNVGGKVIEAKLATSKGEVKLGGTTYAELSFTITKDEGKLILFVKKK